MPDSTKIALFGGTFDPVHLGHIHLASLARDALGLDEVRFIPCRISPHKTGAPHASGADRIEMLRLATASLPWAVADPCELEHEGPSYSWRTARHFATEYPAARLFWIMGGDQWATLPHWRNSEILASLVEFIVLARGGDVPAPLPGHTLHVVHGSHPASATAIREALHSGAPSPSWLAPAVADLIASRRLYRG